MTATVSRRSPLSPMSPTHSVPSGAAGQVLGVHRVDVARSGCRATAQPSGSSRCTCTRRPPSAIAQSAVAVGDQTRTARPAAGRRRAQRTHRRGHREQSGGQRAGEQQPDQCALPSEGAGPFPVGRVGAVRRDRQERQHRGGQLGTDPGAQPGAVRRCAPRPAPRPRRGRGRPASPARRAAAARRRPRAAAAARRSGRAAGRCRRRVRAETNTASGSRWRSRASCRSPAASVLFTTSSSRGIVPSRCSPTSTSTWRTALIWSSGSASEASTTCTQQVRVGGLLQRGAERLDELVRQVPDEPDGVGQRVAATVRGGGAPGGRVEGGEQRVLDQHAGVGQRVEQARLAGVGVADDGHRGHLVAPARRRAGSRGPASSRRSRGAAWTSGCGSGAGPARSWSHRGRGRRCRRRPRRDRRPAGTAPHPSRAAAAAGRTAGPARPAPCRPGSGRAGRRCPGSARSGRSP